MAAVALDKLLIPKVQLLPISDGRQHYPLTRLLWVLGESNVSQCMAALTTSPAGFCSAHCPPPKITTGEDRWRQVGDFARESFALAISWCQEGWDLLPVSRWHLKLSLTQQQRAWLRHLQNCPRYLMASPLLPRRANASTAWAHEDKPAQSLTTQTDVT